MDGVHMPRNYEILKNSNNPPVIQRRHPHSYASVCTCCISCVAGELKVAALCIIVLSSTNMSASLVT
eukprot:7581103-Ditylum_brightwellii.AAC.1